MTEYSGSAFSAQRTWKCMALILLFSALAALMTRLKSSCNDLLILLFSHITHVTVPFATASAWVLML